MSTAAQVFWGSGTRRAAPTTAPWPAVGRRLRAWPRGPLQWPLEYLQDKTLDPPTGRESKLEATMSLHIALEMTHLHFCSVLSAIQTKPEKMWGTTTSA